MPITTGFNHVATLTTDMHRTVAFYETVFEAQVVFEMERTDACPWLTSVDVGGGAAISGFGVPAGEIVGERRRPGGRGGVDDFAFAVDTRAALDIVRERMIAAGAQEVGEIQQLGPELSLFFRDPDGMELEVCCPGS